MSLGTSSPTIAFDIGQLVYVRGETGWVRFIGTTEFSTGQWVGIELENPSGKNDGSVNGVRYFVCEKNDSDKALDGEVVYYGIFVRPPAVSLTLPSGLGSAVGSSSGGGGEGLISRPLSRAYSDRLKATISPMGPPNSRPRESAISSRPASGASVELRTTLSQDSSPLAPSARPISAASATTTMSTMSSVDSETMSVSANQIERLKAKLRTMERKRKEDYDKLVAIKGEVKDKQRLENIIQKLQNKMAPMSQELNKVRDELKLLEEEKSRLSERQDIHDEELENMALDRELAEARVEELTLNIESLRKKIEELELECEILREENSLLSLDKSTDELHEVSQTNSAALLKSNHRIQQLEKALIALRDISATKEDELMVRITGLEITEREYRKLSDQLKTIQARYKEAQVSIKELRGQLDDALGSEDMIERLTDQNLELQEQCENLKRTIEELEILKELNDELEVSHQLTETQLQSEIDDIESRFHQQSQNLDMMEERNEYLEDNIEKFRELVRSLHSELESLKSNSANSTTRTSELVIEAKHMMDLNIKLQQTSIGSQVKEIDIELLKVNLILATDRMMVYQSYGSRLLTEDEEAISALFTAKRVLFKGNLLFRYFDKCLQEETRKEQEGSTFSFFSLGNYVLACGYLCDIVALLQATIEYVSTSAEVDTFSSLVVLKSPLQTIEATFDLEINRLKDGETSEQDLRTSLSTSAVALRETMGSTKYKPGRFAVYDETVCNEVKIVLSSVIGVCNKVHEVIIDRLKFDAGGSHGCELLDISKCLQDLKRIIEEIFEKQRKQTTPSNLASNKPIEDCFKYITSISEFLCGVAFHLDSVLSVPLADEEISFLRDSFDAVLLELSCGANTLCFENSQGESAEDNKRSEPFLFSFSSILHLLQRQVDILGRLQASLEFTPRKMNNKAPWEIRGGLAGSDQIYKEVKDNEIEALKSGLRELQLTLRSKEKIMEELEVKMTLYDSKIAKSSSQEAKIEKLRQLIDEASAKQRVLTEQLKAANQTIEEKDRDLAQRQESMAITQAKKRGSLGTLEDWLTSYSESMKCQYLLTEVEQLRGAVNKLNTSEGKVNNDYDWLDSELLKPKMKGISHRSKATEILKRARDLSVFVQPVTVDYTPQYKWRPANTSNSYKVNIQRRMVNELNRDLAEF